MSKNLMSIEEAKKMVGTEFIYETSVYKIRSYVKAFDPTIGFTCYSLDTVDELDFSPSLICKLDLSDDDTFCVVAYNFDVHPIEEALEDLQIIKYTGRLGDKGIPEYGAPSCAF